MILALAPFLTPGGSVILGWVLSLALIALIFIFVVWLFTKIIGPPNIPEQFRWIAWVVILVMLLLMVASAFGLHIP